MLKVMIDLLMNLTFLVIVDQHLKEYITHEITENLCSGIASYLVIVSPSKENRKRVIDREKYIKEKSPYFYNRMRETSKFIRLLRMTHYMFFKSMYKMKIKQLENENMKKF